MGEGAWQHDIFRGPSCGLQLTYETIKSTARSSENIMLPRPLSHELRKLVLSVI